MSWVCPNCGRNFKHRNQAHTCAKIDIASVFANMSPVVLSIWEKLYEVVNKFGEVNASATRQAIMFSVGHTFLAVKPKKECLDIEFLLNEEHSSPPVYKTFRANKTRIAHFVRLESPDDLTKKLVAMLNRAHKLSAGK